MERFIKSYGEKIKPITVLYRVPGLINSFAQRHRGTIREAFKTLNLMALGGRIPTLFDPQTTAMIIYEEYYNPDKKMIS